MVEERIGGRTVVSFNFGTMTGTDSLLYSCQWGRNSSKARVFFQSKLGNLGTQQ